MKKKIIITGFARSGTTALCDLLNIDGRLFITNECHQFLPPHGQSQFINLNWAETVRRLRGLMTRHDVSAKFLLNVLERDRFVEYIDEQTADSVIYTGDKTPRPYLYNLQEVILNAGKHSKDVKVLLCVRDGRDVITSAFWGERAYPKQFSLVEEWATSMINIKPAISELSSIIKLVKYEDAVSNPEKTVEEISEFLGLSSTLNIEGHEYRPTHIGQWTKKFPAFKDYLPGVLREALTLYGYLEEKK
jgi:sulfotransferase family protein